MQGWLSWPLLSRVFTILASIPFGVVAAMERRLAAILAAGVIGYGHLTVRNEEDSTATLLPGSIGRIDIRA
jgi:hypothetical protein